MAEEAARLARIADFEAASAARAAERPVVPVRAEPRGSAGFTVKPAAKRETSGLMASRDKPGREDSPVATPLAHLVATTGAASITPRTQTIPSEAEAEAAEAAADARRRRLAELDAIADAAEAAEAAKAAQAARPEAAATTAAEEPEAEVPAELGGTLEERAAAITRVQARQRGKLERRQTEERVGQGEMAGQKRSKKAAEQDLAAQRMQARVLNPNPNPNPIPNLNPTSNPNPNPNPDPNQNPNPSGRCRP